MTAMTFSGWPIEAVEFYEGLEADNSKVYWQEHKAVYDRFVKAPMEELLAELADEFGAGRLFRPYRDVRFSADKTPYKTNCAARLGDGCALCRGRHAGDRRVRMRAAPVGGRAEPGEPAQQGADRVQMTQRSAREPLYEGEHLPL